MFNQGSLMQADGMRECAFLRDTLGMLSRAPMFSAR